MACNLLKYGVLLLSAFITAQEDYEAVVDKLVNFKLLNSLNLTLDDVTTESIAENMNAQNGCISIVSSEGGMVDIISGLYSKLVNLDIYLKGYSGDSLKVDRIGRDSLYIPNPRLTILLTVQPKVLENFITNSTFEGRGLTARFLYSIPKSLVGSRKFNTEPITYESKQAFISLVNDILNESNQATTYIHLSDEATSLLEEYHNKFEVRLATDLKEIGSWAGKLLGNILRLSAIITRARGIKYDEFLGYKPSTDDSAVWIVQKDDMANAIKVGEYFLEHAQCAFNLLGVDQKTKDAKTLRKKSKQTCSSHQIRNIVLEKLILQRINDMINLVHNSESEFVELVTKQTKENTNRKLKEAKKEYEIAMARINKLDSIIQHLYEDNIEGKISDDRFSKLSVNYEIEQADLTSKIKDLDIYINEETNKLVNVESFVTAVKKYTHIETLDCEVLRELVSKVFVYKVEKIDGKRQQRIDVIFNGLEGIKLDK